MFTEPELSPIREEEQASTEDLCPDKSSGASSESVKTVAQVDNSGDSPQVPGSVPSSTSQPEGLAATEMAENSADTATEKDSQSPTNPKQQSVEEPPSTPTATSSSSQKGSQSSADPGATDTTCASASPQGDGSQGTDSFQTNTMQKGKEEKENEEQTPADGKRVY